MKGSNGVDACDRCKIESKTPHFLPPKLDCGLWIIEHKTMSTPSGNPYPEEEGGESITGVIIALLLLGSLAYLTFKVSWVCSWCNVQGFLNAKLLTNTPFPFSPPHVQKLQLN